MAGYLDKYSRLVPQEEILEALGPLGRMVTGTVEERVNYAEQADRGGIANNTHVVGDMPRDIVARQGTYIPPNTAYAFWPGVKGHEARHLLPDVPGAESYDHGHPWVHANEIYDARSPNEAVAAARMSRSDGYDPSELKPMVDAMAGTEYDMGGRLMFDPSRGHHGDQVAQSAMMPEAILDPRQNYVDYRNRQSGIMGNPQWWEKLDAI